MSESPYHAALAHVHNVGFGRVAEAAAAYALPALQNAGHVSGLVVDLGCGSGNFLDAVNKAGYACHGVDLSAAMLDIARSRVPQGTFVQASIYDAEIPPCVCVAATGEVINYAFTHQGADDDLLALFQRIRAALAPGGLLLLDIATPDRAPAGGDRQYFVEGDGWTVLVHAQSPPDRTQITRRIITFHDASGTGHYQRDEETHEQRLLDPAHITALLQEADFVVLMPQDYCDFPLPGWAPLAAWRVAD